MPHSFPERRGLPVLMTVVMLVRVSAMGVPMHVVALLVTCAIVAFVVGAAIVGVPIGGILAMAVIVVRMAGVCVASGGILAVASIVVGTVTAGVSGLRGPGLRAQLVGHGRAAEARWWAGTLSRRCST